MAEKKKKSRAKASRLVSKYLLEMASKEDACIDDSEGSRMCVRAERLAELIWKNALGFIEDNVITGAKIEHPPSLSYMKILLERMEGKVQDVFATKSKKSIADRISEKTKSTINSIAEGKK